LIKGLTGCRLAHTLPLVLPQDKNSPISYEGSARSPYYLTRTKPAVR